MFRGDYGVVARVVVNPMLGKNTKPMTRAPAARAGPFQHRFSHFGSSNPSKPRSSLQIALEPTWFPAVENRGEECSSSLGRKQ